MDARTESRRCPPLHRRRGVRIRPRSGPDGQDAQRVGGQDPTTVRAVGGSLRMRLVADRHGEALVRPTACERSRSIAPHSWAAGASVWHGAYAPEPRWQVSGSCRARHQPQAARASRSGILRWSPCDSRRVSVDVLIRAIRADGAYLYGDVLGSLRTTTNATRTVTSDTDYDIYDPTTNKPCGYTDGNPLQCTDLLGLWSWNPLKWTKSEWSTVSSVAGAVALGTGLVAATVLTAGVAGVAVSGIALGSGVLSVGAGAANAALECTDGGAVYHCARSVGVTVLSALGIGGAIRVSSAAWSATRLTMASKLSARAEWLAWSASGLFSDAYEGAYSELNGCSP